MTGVTASRAFRAARLRGRGPHEPLLSVRGVHKTYTAAKRSKVVALEDVDLDVGEGEIVALIGPSGCGKSTLLRMMAGLDTDFEGDLSWSVPPRPGKDIGFVFQEPALLPWRTVRRNVSLGLEAQRDTSEQGREQVATLLDLVGLTDFADSFPKELSGGMRQRTAIARALAYNPGSCSWTSPSGRWTRSPGTGFTTTCCASGKRPTRPSSWSPTASRRPPTSPTASL